MISATNGHDIKYKASQKLNSDVDRFLENGGSIKVYDCPIDEKTEVIESLDCYKKSRRVVKNKMIDDMNYRLVYQKPFLKEYYERVGKNAFSKLSKAIGGKVRASYFNLVMDGYNSIKDPDKWFLVKKEATRIMKELDV